MSAPRAAIATTPPPLDQDVIEAAISCVHRCCPDPDNILQALGLTP